MKESYVRTLEALVAITASYMAAITMVQTTLYSKIITKITNSIIGPILEPYTPYFGIAIILIVLFISFSLWRKGDEVGFGRLFNLNMLMFFPSVLDYSTFNWVGLIFDLSPTPGVTHIWVFSVGLLLQMTYFLLRYTVRFRYIREELKSRGSDTKDIDQITRGQVSYLVLLVSLTGIITSGIYLLAPYLNKLSFESISNLPAPRRLWFTGQI